MARDSPAFVPRALSALLFTATPDLFLAGPAIAMWFRAETPRGPLRLVLDRCCLELPRPGRPKFFLSLVAEGLPSRAGAVKLR